MPILRHTLGLHTLAAILWRYFGAAMKFWLRYWGCNDTLAHFGAAMILGPYIASAEDSVLTCSPTHTRCVRHDCSDQTSSHHTLYVSIPKLLDALFDTLRHLATPHDSSRHVTPPHNTLRHPTHYDTLRHCSKHCGTLRHTAAPVIKRNQWESNSTP